MATQVAIRFAPPSSSPSFPLRSVTSGIGAQRPRRHSPVRRGAGGAARFYRAGATNGVAGAAKSTEGKKRKKRKKAELF